MRIYLINAVILVSIALLALLFDAYLQLGQFHGLVFAMYTLYASVAQSLVNIVLGFWRKKKEHHIFAGVLLAILLIVVIVAEIV